MDLESAIQGIEILETIDGEEKMIRKLSSGKYRLYSRKKDPATGRRKNLGTFKTREAAEKHERAVQFLNAKVSGSLFSGDSHAGSLADAGTKVESDLG